MQLFNLIDVLVEVVLCVLDQVYYFNTVTQDSSWEKPEGFEGEVLDVAEQPVPVATETITGTDWTRVKCKDGRK